MGVISDKGQRVRNWEKRLCAVPCQIMKASQHQIQVKIYSTQIFKVFQCFFYGESGKGKVCESCILPVEIF